MRSGTKRNTIWFVLRASTALALLAAPYQFAVDDGGLALVSSAAHARSGSSGGSNSSGSGSSGSGGGHQSGNSGSSVSGGNSGGSGGDDDGANHDANDDHGDDNDDGDDEDHHVNPATGDRVEIGRNSIEVKHRDGTKEEIENGRYEMKDAAGRTIVERRATNADVARLRGFAG